MTTASTKAGVLYTALILAALLPFMSLAITYLYWFACAPRCTILSCGRKLKASPWCPGQNPFKQTIEKIPTPAPSTSAKSRWKSARKKIRAMQLFSTNGASAASETKTTSLPVASAAIATTPLHSTRDGWITTNLLLIWILIPSIVKASFETLQKVTICEEAYWALDDTVLYDSLEHWTMKSLVAIPALLVFGAIFPLLALIYIGQHKDRQTNRKLMFRFGLLYSGYSPHLWWWEIVLYFRKICIILIVTFASTNQQQLHIGTLTCIVLKSFFGSVLIF